MGFVLTSINKEIADHSGENVSNKQYDSECPRIIKSDSSSKTKAGRLMN